MSGLEMLLVGFLIGGFGGILTMGIIQANNMTKYEYLLILYSYIKDYIKSEESQKLGKLKDINTIVKEFEEINT
jgi:hypothetical protein